MVDSCTVSDVIRAGAKRGRACRWRSRLPHQFCTLALPQQRSSMPHSISVHLRPRSAGSVPFYVLVLKKNLLALLWATRPESTGAEAGANPEPKEYFPTGAPPPRIILITGDPTGTGGIIPNRCTETILEVASRGPRPSEPSEGHYSQPGHTIYHHRIGGTITGLAWTWITPEQTHYLST